MYAHKLVGHQRPTGTGSLIGAEVPGGWKTTHGGAGDSPAFPEQQELLPLSPSPAPGTQLLGLVLSFKGLS